MDIKEYLSTIGKRGGKRTSERGPDYFREIQKKSVQARKRNKTQPQHD